MSIKMYRYYVFKCLDLFWISKNSYMKSFKAENILHFLKIISSVNRSFSQKMLNILQPAVKKADCFFDTVSWKPENIKKRGQNLAFTWHIRVTAVWLWFVALSWALLCESIPSHSAWKQKCPSRLSTTAPPTLSASSPLGFFPLKLTDTLIQAEPADALGPDRNNMMFVIQRCK